MSRETSVRDILVFGSYVVFVFHEMIFLSLRTSIYGTNVLDFGTSLNDETVSVGAVSFIAFARIFAASARVIGASGRKSPSAYPLIHPFFTANVIYSAYHFVLSTSGKLESTQTYSYRHDSDRTSIFTNSARVTLRYGSNFVAFSAIPYFLYSSNV
jgi:hypothetical protein